MTGNDLLWIRLYAALMLMFRICLMSRAVKVSFSLFSILYFVLKQFYLPHHFLIVFQPIQHFVQVFVVHLLSLQNQRDRPRKIWVYIKTDAAFGVAASVFVFSYVKNTIVICDKSSALEWNSCEKSATKKRHESHVYPRCGKHG